MSFLSKTFNPVATAAKGWFHETVAAPERTAKVYANIMAPVITMTAIILPLYATEPAASVLGGVLSAITFAPLAKSWHNTGSELAAKTPGGPA